MARDMKIVGMLILNYYKRIVANLCNAQKKTIYYKI